MHTFDVTRLTTRQISQDISFYVCEIGPRFTFCFPNSIIHGAVRSSPFQLRIAMQRAKKPFQEKRIQSRPQSYSAFRTKRTMCLATVSFCNSTEATERAKGSNPLIHLSFLDQDTIGVFPPPPLFMPSSIVFLLEISVAAHKQNPEWFACWCAEGAASDGAGERSNKARCLFHPSRRGESHQRREKKKKSTPLCAQLQHLSDVRFLTD